MNNNRDQDRAQPVDALDLWASDSPLPPDAALSVIRLDNNEVLLIPFTTAMVRCKLHYVDAAALRSYVHCGGPTCLLCRLGSNAEVRDLLPVYGPVGQAVTVVPISPNVRPQALRPQLHPILQRVKEGERLLVGVRKLDQVRFAVSVWPLPDDADDGTEHIEAFQAKVETGAVDLASAYQRLATEELAAIPEIERKMKLKGIKLP